MESKSWKSVSKESQASSGQTLLGDDPPPGRWVEPAVEHSDLRLVRDDISMDIFLVAAAELAERFTYRSVSAPIRSLENGAGFPGLVAALILIGLGTGAIKSNVGPLIAEQYQSIGPRVKTLPDGEQVLSLMGIVVRPPNGSAITKAMRILWIGIRSGGNLEAARPASLEKTGVSVPWDDVFVDELKCALVACRVFLLSDGSCRAVHNAIRDGVCLYQSATVHA
ncbi:hypothetical protein APSETT444_009813 [Aspergillus pseudonomiae]